MLDPVGHIGAWLKYSSPLRAGSRRAISEQRLQLALADCKRPKLTLPPGPEIDLGLGPPGFGSNTKAP